MFTGCIRGVVSFHQATRFERARIQATYSGDWYAPNEEDLKVIIDTILGKDRETRASIAFQTITTKLKTSESRKYWPYIVKNLVILDRVVEERYYIKEISELELPKVESYDIKDKQHKEKMIEELIGNYYRFIKAKAEIYWNRGSSLNVPRNQRKKFFSEMDSEDILAENHVLNAISISAFDIFKTSGQGHLKYKLNQYVFLLVLSSVINIFSTQYVAFIVLIERFFDMELEMARECYTSLKTFLQRTEDLIKFTGNHQFIPGFQISLHELRNPAVDGKLLKTMEEYIKLLEDYSQGIWYNPDEKDLEIAALNQAPQSDSSARSPLKLHDFTPISDTFSLTPMMSPFKGRHKKNLSTSFENTFSCGFHALVSVGARVADEILEQYKVDEEVPEEEGRETHKMSEYNEENQEKLGNRNLTRAFKKIISIEEADDLLFAAYQNHYSTDPEEERPKRISLRPSARPVKTYYEFKTLGIVLTKCDNYLKAYEEVETVTDFNQDIFDNFKNSYSKDFRL